MAVNTGVNDVAITLGRPIPDSQTDQVTQWIEDAALLIRVRLGDLDALDEDVLNYVVREAVAARLRNPNGYLSESVDDYTYRRANDNASGGWITETWWAMLSPAGDDQAFTITPYDTSRRYCW